jgi:hypothetical protein
VSWITTEEIDRENKIVVARCMNDSHFKLNPIMTLQHCYWQPPVGKSLRRQQAMDGPLVGIKARRSTSSASTAGPTTTGCPT